MSDLCCARKCHSADGGSCPRDGRRGRHNVRVGRGLDGKAAGWAGVTVRDPGHGERGRSAGHDFAGSPVVPELERIGWAVDDSTTTVGESRSERHRRRRRNGEVRRKTKGEGVATRSQVCGRREGKRPGRRRERDLTRPRNRKSRNSRGGGTCDGNGEVHHASRNGGRHKRED